MTSLTPSAAPLSHDPAGVLHGRLTKVERESGPGQGVPDGRSQQTVATPAALAFETRCLDVFNIHLDSSAYTERQRMESEQAIRMAVQLSRGTRTT